MQETTLNSWQEFEDVLHELEKCRERLSEGKGGFTSKYLYRGQSNSTWELQTTLERFTSQTLTVTDYYRFACAAKAKIETFTDKKWDIFNPSEYESWIKDQSNLSLINMPSYEYLAYLRHHGYPSPLLDWTSSPYIALFFAFRNPSSSTHVSIYVYMEYAYSGKIYSLDEPHIQLFGPNATIHRRHFLQQSSYTSCMKKQGNNYILTSHEAIMKKSKQTQDLMWKFNLPVTDRKFILGKLNTMNINAYSLFPSIDSLMEAVSISENRFSN